MKKILFYGITAVLCLTISAPVFAQDAPEITTMWMTDHNDDGSMLPILVKKGRTLDDEGNEVNGGEGPAWANGARTQDRYMGLVRYDDTRLLLGIFGNGINEFDPDHDAELAAQFPDRSLIWIDAGTGEPMGVALEIGFEPVELPQYYIDAYGSPVPFFTDFDLDDDGNVFVAFGPFILRYNNQGDDTFSEPDVVFTITEEMITNEDNGIGPEDWGVSTFNVEGSGADTLITGGQNGTGFYITTDDGNLFDLEFTYQRGWPGVNGAQSNVIFDEAFGEEWIFVAGYGNASRGDDSTFNRMIRFPEGDETFVDDTELFSAQGVEDAGVEDYQANYVGDIAGADELDWIAVYSTPSWDVTVRRSPGFLALHDVSGTAEQDGGLLTAMTLEVYSDEELRLADGNVSSWFGTEGNLEVNVVDAETGAAEILWIGGIYGYGRFAVGDVPTQVNTWSLY